jgi:hypothetical protein
MDISKNDTVEDVLANLDLSIDTPVSANDSNVDDSAKEAEINDVAVEVAEEVEKMTKSKSKDVVLNTSDTNVAPDTKTLIIQFVVRYLHLVEQKKAVDHDIKELKQEFSELGIAHSMTLKALANVQKRKKMSYSQRDELDSIQAILEQSREVSDALEALENM